MIKRIFLTGFVYILPLISVLSANVLDIEGGEATSVGIYIKSLADDSVLVDENAELALTPASVTKVVTSATALSLLGPDFKFSTEVELVGKRSAAARTTWEGNLVINASGDPTLESPELKKPGFTDSIISGLKRLGISRITGTVIIDEKMPGAGPIPQWEVEDIAWPYGAGLFGFNYGGNYVRLNPTTGKSVPPSSLKVEVRTADRTDMLRGVESENVIIWASKKNQQNPKWTQNVTIPNPAAVYKNLLKSRLREAGISISDKGASVAANASETKVYTHKSPALLKICRDLMKRSDNLFAEGMLRALLPGESRSKCIKREKDYWASQGVESKYTIINDGSGLTRANRISPLFLGSILEKMLESENSSRFVDFFPVAGVDGTLKSFLEKTRLKGRLALKTGSVSSVQTYAGYKLDAEGEPTHIVVIMVNGFFCPRKELRKKIEDYLLTIFE